MFRWHWNLRVSLLFIDHLFLLFFFVDVHYLLLHLILGQRNIRLLFTLFRFPLQAFTWFILSLFLLLFVKEKSIFAGRYLLLKGILLERLFFFNLHYFLRLQRNVNNILELLLDLSLSPFISAVVGLFLDLDQLDLWIVPLSYLFLLLAISYLLLFYVFIFVYKIFSLLEGNLIY